MQILQSSRDIFGGQRLSQKWLVLKRPASKQDGVNRSILGGEDSEGSRSVGSGIWILGCFSDVVVNESIVSGYLFFGVTA